MPIILIVAVAILAIELSPGSRAQGIEPASNATCEVAPPWKVDLRRSRISLIFDPAEVDSSDNVARGLPYATGSNVVLVVSDSVCATVVTAHNSLASDLKIDGQNLSSAMVFDLNGTGFALIAGSKSQMIIFDANLNYFRAWAL